MFWITEQLKQINRTKAAKEMIYNGGNLLDRDFHQSCEHYNRCGESAVVEIIRIDKDRNYEREMAQAEVLIVNKGSSNVSFRGIGEVVVKAGQMIIVPPDIVLSVSVDEPSEIIRLGIDFEHTNCHRIQFEQLVKFKKQIKGIFNTLEINAPLRTFIEILIKTLDDGLMCNKHHRSKVTEFVHILAGYYSVREIAAFLNPLLDSDLIFKHIIRKNLRSIHSLEEYALLTKMSRSGFHDRFKRVFGEAPKTFIRRERAELLKNDLIKSEIPLKILASQYGFNSYEVFFRFCVKMLGATPTKIRLGV